MKSLYSAETEDTPQVILDPENKKLIFAKRSLPENAYQFYQPIIEWLQDYIEKTESEILIEFMFDYFNTSSAKQILKIMNLFELYCLRGKNIKVRWYHLEEDDDMKISGERFAKICDVPFEIIEYYSETLN